MCTMLVTVTKTGPNFVIVLMIPEPCCTHQYVYATWSTFSDRFHTVSFRMQSHDYNLTLSLKCLCQQTYDITLPRL